MSFFLHPYYIICTHKAYLKILITQLQKLQILSVIQILFISAGFSINTSECLRKNIVNQSFLVIHQNDASFSLYVKCLRFVLTYLTGHFFLYLLTMLCEMSIIWLEYYYLPLTAVKITVGLSFETEHQNI